jgi:hypothetical protein
MEREKFEPDPDWRHRLRDGEDVAEEDSSAHGELSNPAVDPDPTEWPDPYDKREDPRDEPDGDGSFRGEPGAVSTSEPYPAEDPEGSYKHPEGKDRLAR